VNQQEQERADRADAVLVAQLREIVAMLTSCCEDAAAREWALGVQVAAQAQRLRLAEAFIREARTVLVDSQDMRVEGHRAASAALAAFDAVPGDVGPVDLG
jgi:triosephosphate isomerase